jgi:hypothetical protein
MALITRWQKGSERTSSAISIWVSEKRLPFEQSRFQTAMDISNFRLLRRQSLRKNTAVQNQREAEGGFMFPSFSKSDVRNQSVTFATA